MYTANTVSKDLLLDIFLVLSRENIETCRLVTKPWNDLISQRSQLIPYFLRHSIIIGDQNDINNEPRSKPVCASCGPDRPMEIYFIQECKKETCRNDHAVGGICGGDHYFLRHSLFSIRNMKNCAFEKLVIIKMSEEAMKCLEEIVEGKWSSSCF